MDNPFEHVPPWVLRELPANAENDTGAMTKIRELTATFPVDFHEIRRILNRNDTRSTYDGLVNVAVAGIWRQLDRFFTADDCAHQLDLLGFASRHMVAAAKARIYRRFVKAANRLVRQRAAKLLGEERLAEVALPDKPDGPWDTSGWKRGLTPSRSPRRPSAEVPPLETLADLRGLLRIASPRQLGYLLLASDAEGGPYSTYTIAKRSGGERLICAPHGQLRTVQRRILHSILDQVAPHPSAFGFIRGRSTVDNAKEHLGAQLLLKFDLTDFFPTIHYYRVMGLFAGLGYALDDAKFGTDDGSTQVAPVLARLCCYVTEPNTWGLGRLPQGAPTSPAISNLICRRLDARLAGLAAKIDGVYTRYADDLTFSFGATPPDVGRFRWWVDQICHQEGFFVNQRKFRVIRPSQRQCVTGIVVNQVIRIPRTERRRFRAILHNCRRLGLASQARGNPKFADYLRGFASYIYMVHPQEGRQYLEEVDNLLDREARDPS